MNYQKDSEYFQKIMTKEDTKELSSIINLLNSKSPDEKIGLNLQYRQIKIPQSIYNSLKERKLKAQKFLENEKTEQNNINIISLYEDNKAREEQYIREHMINMENIEKKIRKLNHEENDILQEIENIKNNIYNLSQKYNNLKIELEKSKNFISLNQVEEKKIHEKINEMKEKKKKKKKIIENKKLYEKYNEEKKKIKEEEIKIKKMLCVKCQSQPRIYYYTGCKHLALCKNCYVHSNNAKKCPICSKISELLIKVNIEKPNYI